MSDVRRSGGFTLLELLVALSVFALVSLMAYSGLRSVLQSKQATDQRAQRIQQLQSAVLMLERDLSQIALLRGIRDDFGDVQPPLRHADFGSILLEFTRAGRRNPMGMARSNLQRVAYGIDEEKLQRSSWRVLDRAQQAAPDKVVLLEEVREMRLRYRDEGGEWHEQWPPTGQGPGAPTPLPSALEVTLVLEEMGEIRRLFPLLRTSPFTTVAPPGGGKTAQGDKP